MLQYLMLVQRKVDNMASASETIVVSWIIVTLAVSDLWWHPQEGDFFHIYYQLKVLDVSEPTVLSAQWGMDGGWVGNTLPLGSRALANQGVCSADIFTTYLLTTH
jgi:hypothetical protein